MRPSTYAMTGRTHRCSPRTPPASPDRLVRRARAALASGTSGVGHGRPMGEDHAVGGAAGAPLVGHDVERAAVVAAEHAREAPTVGRHGVEHCAAFGDPRAALTGNAGVPDRPV